MKHQYFYNFGTPLIEGKEYENFVSTFLIDQKHLHPQLGYLELIFNDEEVLSKVTIINNGVEENKERYKYLKIDEALGKLSYKNYNPIVPFSMKLNKNGISYLGGNLGTFNIPSGKQYSKFQYFGQISKDEECFPQLDFDINLTFPLFCSAGELFLDYSDNLQPKIFNEKEFWTDEVFDGLDKDFEITYKKTPISFEKISGKIFERDEIGISGHYLCDFGSCYSKPTSPITNKPMEYLCQIEGGKLVPTEHTNVPKDYYLFDYGFNYLQFYSGNGEITIFYENETRLVLYLIGGS